MGGFGTMMSKSRNQQSDHSATQRVYTKVQPSDAMAKMLSKVSDQGVLFPDLGGPTPGETLIFDGEEVTLPNPDQFHLL